MLISLIPSSINHFCQCRVVVGTLEGRDIRKGLGLFKFRFSRGERIRRTAFGAFRPNRRRMRVVEDPPTARAEALVENEKIKVIMLGEVRKTGSTNRQINRVNCTYMGDDGTSSHKQ